MGEDSDDEVEVTKVVKHSAAAVKEEDDQGQSAETNADDASMLTVKDIDNMSFHELRSECKRRNLGGNGKKGDLQEKLKAKFGFGAAPAAPARRQPTRSSSGRAQYQERRAQYQERRAHNQDRERRCQLQFTASGEEVPFTSKKDGRVALTTNTPREVEAINPVTNLRVHLFNSCTDAARITGINRTKMSRTCRKGGEKLDSTTHGTLLFRYSASVEAAVAGGDSDSDSEVRIYYAASISLFFDKNIISLTPTVSSFIFLLLPQDDDMGFGEDEDDDTATLAVAVALAAGDAIGYAEALAVQKKLPGFSL